MPKDGILSICYDSRAQICCFETIYNIVLNASRVFAIVDLFLFHNAVLSQFKTHLRCSAKRESCCKFTAESNSERILENGQHLSKL